MLKELNGHVDQNDAELNMVSSNRMDDYQHVNKVSQYISSGDYVDQDIAAG